MTISTQTSDSNSVQAGQRQRRGLLVVMMDIDPDNDAEFNRWYDEEHIPEKRAYPGFLSARRFRALDGSLRYMAVYELEDANIAVGPEYMSQQQSEWAKRMSKLWKNLSRSVWVEITQA